MECVSTPSESVDADHLIQEATQRLASQAERVRQLKAQTMTCGELRLAETLLRTMQDSVRAMHLSRRAIRR